MTTVAREIHLIRRPEGLPSKDSFKFVDVKLPELEPGQILVRNLWMSVDPYMRGRMEDRPSYIPPFQLNHVLEGAAVGEVVQTRASGLSIGDRVVHFAGWRDHAVLTAEAVTRIESDIAPQAYLGALGFPGLTAYVGLTKLAQIDAGETIFVSAASGAVGSIVAQIAKLKGLRVVASVGSSSKAQWLLDLGIDAVVNYREAANLTDALATAAPEGIDVYFDNVGGAHLEAALSVANDHARFVLCGMIGGYNDNGPATGPSNIYQAVEKRIKMQGMIVSDHVEAMPEFINRMSDWIRQEKIVVRETVVDGLGNAPEAFLGLFRGANIGKMLVRL